MPKFKLLIYIFVSFTIFIFISCQGTSPFTGPSINNLSVNIPQDALVITEIGSLYTDNSSAWMEVYNRSSQTVSLSSFLLKCTSFRTNDNSFLDRTYNLPNISIQPGAFAMIRGTRFVDLVTAGQTAFINSINGSELIYPLWYFSTGFTNLHGYAELLLNGKTVDFVRFGVDSTLPTTGNFSGNAPTIISSNANSYGRGIGRDGANVDTDSGSDFTFRTIATPGGPNDVTSDIDLDQDGIPDANEMSDTTFAGLPLYDYGARTSQKDIFIHIDYMDSSDLGIVPKKEALDKIKAAFLVNGYHVHFDVGDLFDAAGGIDPVNHDLSDESHVVPFANGIALGETGEGHANAYTYKNTYMPINRKQIFHYLIMGNSQKADGSLGNSGVAEVKGNDIIVSLGNVIGTYPVGVQNNIAINWQSATIMHELGHNLGLLHGGNTDVIYKPNYYSVMNYTYQLNGLSTLGANEGDRYYKINNLLGYSDSSFTLLEFGPDEDPSLFKINYSDGTGASLDESNLNENSGIGRGTGSADYNGNSSLESGISQNVNYPYDANSSGVHQDYNDWGNLFLFFSQNFSGDTTGAVISTPGTFYFKNKIGDDKQPIASPCPAIQCNRPNH